MKKILIILLLTGFTFGQSSAILMLMEDEADMTAPASISDLAAVGGISKVTYTWTDPPDADLGSFRVYGWSNSNPTTSVKCGGYYSVAEGVGNLTLNGTVGRDYLVKGQRFRFRQTGKIDSMKLQICNSGITEFYLTIWRKDGSTYDLVDISNNLISQVADSGIATVSLGNIDVQEGDYYGFRGKTVPGISPLFGSGSLTSTKLYYVNSTTSIDYDWESQSNLDGFAIYAEFYIKAPDVVFIGNSIIAGHPAHYSFLETTETTDISATIEYQLNSLNGWTYQNMGIGSQTTTNILARFKTNVVDLSPSVVVIEGGVNDIAGGVLTTTIISNYTKMLDSCYTHNMIGIVVGVLPWTNGTTVQMRQRDSINTQLETLVNTYTGFYFVDAEDSVGQYDATGDAGNLWDIKTEYDADGVHYNTAGHGKIAEVLSLTINNLYTEVAFVAKGIQTWTKTGLVAGQNYYAKLKSKDVSGNLSGYSNDAYATTSPSSPITFAVIGYNDSSYLSWHRVNEADGYIISRSENNVTYANIDTVVTDTTVYDATVVASTLYYYKVRAYNSDGVSVYSNVDSIIVYPLLYSSDFSSAYTGWGGNRATRTANNDGITDGATSYDDCLEVYADGTTGTHYGMYTNAGITAETKYQVKFKYYIPSGQTHVDYMIAWFSQGGTPAVDCATVGTWTSVDEVITTPATNYTVWPHLLTDGGVLSFTGANSADDDRYYLVDYSIRKLYK